MKGRIPILNKINTIKMEFNGLYEEQLEKKAEIQ